MSRLLAAALLAGGLVPLLASCRPPSPGGSRPGAPPAPAPWFEERAAASGINWRLGRAARPALTILEVMGTGCAVADFTGDGWDDLLLVGQEGFGQTGRCALYRNRGDGTFEDVTAGSGLDLPGYYMGCATADIDNDGLVDVFLTGYGVNRLFRCTGVTGGRPRFEERAAPAGLAAKSATEFNSAAAFGDFDGDGWVDLYAGRYIEFTPASRQHCKFAGVDGACPPWIYDPQFGSLYRNRDGRTFVDVTRAAALGGQHGKALGAAWADYNRDGRPDLYVGNDGVAGDLFQNLGARFRNVGAVSGAAYNASGQTQAAMGVDFADYNGDGWPDLVVTTFRQEPTSLYAGREGLFLEHRSLAAGIDLPTREWTGFGVRLADFDNDGWPDLATANGHVLEKEELVDRHSSYRQPMQLFMSERGERFTEQTARAGPGFTAPAVGRGLATGDFDRDGRVDLVVTDLEGPARLLWNRFPGENAWIGFRLRGSRCNRMALGAVVTLRAGRVTRVAECRTSGSYFSASSPDVHFGLGGAAGPARAEIRWPGGGATVLDGLSLNRYHEVDQARGLIPRPGSGQRGKPSAR